MNHKRKNKIILVSFIIFVLQIFFISCFTVSTNREQNDSIDYVRLAREAKKKFEFNQAVTYYSKQIDIDPDSFIHYLDRGTIYLFYLGDYEKARNDFFKAMELHFSNRLYEKDYIQEMIVNSYILEGKFENALTACEKGFKLSETKGDWYLIRGKIYKLMGNIEKAIDNNKRATTYEESEGEALKNLASIFKSISDNEKSQYYYNKAIKFYSNKIEEDKQHAGYYRLRANIFKEMNKYDEAIADINDAIEINYFYTPVKLKQFFETYLFAERGVIYTKMGEYEAAIEDFNKLINFENEIISPVFIGESYHLNFMGILYHMLEKNDIAIKLFDLAITQNPHYSQAYYNKAIVLKKVGSIEEAKIALEKKLELSKKIDKILYLEDKELLEKWNSEDTKAEKTENVQEIIKRNDFLFKKKYLAILPLEQKGKEIGRAHV